MVHVRGITQIIAKNDELYSSLKPCQSDSKSLIFLVNVENQNIKEDKDRNIKIQYALFKGVERDEFIDKKEFRGALQDQVEEAYQFVLRHINMGAVIDGRKRGLPEPKFEEFGDGIKVTIYRRSDNEWVNGTTQSTTQSTQLPDGRKLSEAEIHIVDAMKENSRITQSQLAARLGIDINTVKYYVRNLSKNNVIERKGNNRTGEWVVLMSP